MRQRDASDLVDQFIDIGPGAPVACLHRSRCSSSVLDRGAGRIRLTARRLLSLAPQVSQRTRLRSSGKPSPTVGSRLRLRACRCRSGCNRGAALMPSALTAWDLAGRRRETAALATGARAMATVSAIVFVPGASQRIAHFRFRRHSGPCRTCRWLNPIANDPDATFRRRETT